MNDFQILATVISGVTSPVQGGVSKRVRGALQQGDPRGILVGNGVRTCVEGEWSAHHGSWTQSRHGDCPTLALTTNA